jgi:hypothetical protein
VHGYVLRDEDNRQLVWKSSSNNPPDVWDGGKLDIEKFTVKEHGKDSYTDDNQTVILRPKVGNVLNLGNAPQWKVSEIVSDAILTLPEDQREAQQNAFYDLSSIEEMRAFATKIAGVNFS